MILLPALSEHSFVFVAAVVVAEIATANCRAVRKLIDGLECPRCLTSLASILDRAGFFLADSSSYV